MHAHRCHDRAGGKLVHSLAEVGGQGCPGGICCCKEGAVGGAGVNVTLCRERLLRTESCMKASVKLQQHLLVFL